MQEKTRGIVLRVLRYSDQAIIVDIYTELRGCLSFWVKSTASRKASVKNMFFTPLSMLELNYDFKPAASCSGYGMSGSLMFIPHCLLSR